MKTFIYMMKMRLLISLTYRFEIISSLISNFIMLLTTVFLWKSVYKGIDVVEGVTENQMLTYAIWASLLNSFFQSTIYDNMRDKIDRGEIGSYFTRPYNIILSFLAEDLGRIFSNILFQVIPLFIFSFVVITFFPLPVNFIAFIIFLISCMLSYGILWGISLIVSLFLFWFINLGSLNFVKDVIVRILSGSIVPLWFFPEWFNNISNYLPFKYTFQTPLSIFIGQIKVEEAGFSLLIQFLWVSLLSFTAFLMWARVKDKVMVQGG